MRRIELGPELPASLLAEIAALPLFAEVEPAARERLLRRAEVCEAAVGDVIFRQGDPSDAIYVLLSGEASVEVALTEGGSAVEVGAVGAGATFGELGVLLTEPRGATITTLRLCRLLRMPIEALRDLFAISPAFALASMRDLARSVKGARQSLDRQAADEAPDAVVMERPDIASERAYMTQYYSAAFQAIARRHRLILSGKLPTYEAPFSMTADQRARWWELFGTTPAAGPHVPFMYCSTTGTMLLMKAVGDVGVNLRHLLHLNGEMHFDPERILVPDEPYRMVLRLDDIVPMGTDRIALVVIYRVYDPAGRLRYSTKEFFLIRHLDPEYLDALRKAPGYGRHPTSHLEGITRRPSELGVEHRVALLPVPDDMAVRYGKISGDPSMWHTTPLAAKLFGFGKPFIQGLCTTNYLMSALTNAGLGPVQSLNVTYARHVFVGTTMDLRASGGRFEIVDSQGKLLAYGSFERASG